MMSKVLELRKKSLSFWLDKLSHNSNMDEVIHFYLLPLEHCLQVLFASEPRVVIDQPPRLTRLPTCPWGNQWTYPSWNLALRWLVSHRSWAGGYPDIHWSTCCSWQHWQWSSYSLPWSASSHRSLCTWALSLPKPGVRWSVFVDHWFVDLGTCCNRWLLQQRFSSSLVSLGEDIWW